MLLLSGLKLSRGVGNCWIMTDDCPLDWMLNEIRKAVDTKLYYLAISIFMTLPDVCAGLEHEKGRDEKDGHKDWHNRFVTEKFSYLSADDAYSFRCGVLHQGRFGNMTHGVSRVFFCVDDRLAVSNCKFDDAYVYSAKEFCEYLIYAVQLWWETAKINPRVISNLPHLVKYHPTGEVPYRIGMPVLG